MNILMLSIDRTSFDSGSHLRERFVEYARLGDHLHVVVAVPTRQRTSQTMGTRCTIYPTSRRSKFRAFIESYRTAAHIVKSNPSSFIVITQEEFTGVIGYLLKKRFHVRWQAQIHTDIGSPFYELVFLKNRIRANIAKQILRSADCIRAVSNRVRNNIQRYVPHVPFGVLPIYVDVDRYRMPRKTNSRHSIKLLVVARLTKEKNVGLILKAFADLLKDYKDLSLCVVGDGPFRKKLKKLSRKLGIAKYVHFEGAVDDIRPFLKDADIFVQTSWYEGYGMALVEAMAAGLPVVSTDVGNVGEICKDGISCFAVPVGEKNPLVHALSRLIADDKLREQMGKEARKATTFLSSREEYYREYARLISLCTHEQ